MGTPGGGVGIRTCMKNTSLYYIVSLGRNKGSGLNKCKTFRPGCSLSKHDKSVFYTVLEDEMEQVCIGIFACQLCSTK